MSALTDGEAKFLLHGDGGDKFCGNGDRVAGHDHLHVLGELDHSGHIGGSEVKLGFVAVEEGGVTTSLFFGEDVNLAFELGMGGDGPGFGEDLTPLKLVFVHPS